MNALFYFSCKLYDKDLEMVLGEKEDAIGNFCHPFLYVPQSFFNLIQLNVV